MKPGSAAKTKLFLIGERAAGALFPRTCPVCGSVIKQKSIKRAVYTALGSSPRPESSGTSYSGSFSPTAPGSSLLGKPGSFPAPDPFVCRKCLEKLDFLEGRSRCMRCSKPLEDSRGEYCADCERKDRYFDRGVAVMAHNEAARKLMYDLKYDDLRANADACAYPAAALLGAAIKDFGADALLPVPLHPARLRERGYNQAEIIAGKIAIYMEMFGYGHIPVDSEYLQRKRNTSRLREMSPERRAEELCGAFCVRGERGRYKKVLLVDDIFTTGATLNECAKTLRQAGTDMIYFITMTIGS